MENNMINSAYEKKDKIMVLLTAVLGFLFCDFIFGGLGVSVLAFISIFYCGVLWYLSKKDNKLSKQGKILFIPIFLLAATFLLFSNPVLKFFNVLLLIFLVFIQLATLTDNLKNPLFSLGTILEFFSFSFAIPIINIPASVNVLKDGEKDSKGKKTVLFILIGLIIALPVLLIVIALLMSADKMFEQLINKMFNFTFNNIGKYVFEVLFGILLAFPLFGLLFALKYKKNNMVFALTAEVMRKAQVVNSIIVNTMLSVFSAVYLLFIGLQFGYLFNAFFGKLPESFIISDYARRGFFEMEAVAVINFFILALALLLTKRIHSKLSGAVKVLFCTLSALTVLLITTALSKMLLYVNIFGLTQLRVYTSVTMLATLIVFIGFMIKTFKPRFGVFRFGFVSTLCLYILLNFACVDYIIPMYNINRYMADPKKTVDVQLFEGLSDEMMPQLARLLDDKDEKVGTMARYIFANRKDEIAKRKNWQEFNISSYLALQNAKTYKFEVPSSEAYYGQK